MHHKKTFKRYIEKQNLNEKNSSKISTATVSDEDSSLADCIIC